MNLSHPLGPVDRQLVNILLSLPGGWVDFPVPEPDAIAVMLLVKNGMARLTLEYTVDAFLRRKSSSFLGMSTNYIAYSERLTAWVTICGNQTPSQHAKIGGLIEKAIPDTWKGHFIEQPRFHCKRDCFMLTLMGHNAKQTIELGMMDHLLMHIHRDGVDLPYPEHEPILDDKIVESMNSDKPQANALAIASNHNDFAPLAAALTNGLSEVNATLAATLAANQMAKPVDQPRVDCIFSLGNRVYRIGDNRAIHLTESEDKVLQSFLKQPAMDEETMKRLSGEDSAVTVFKRLEKRPGFSEFMATPGGKDGGGYHVYIKSIKYNPNEG